MKKRLGWIPDLPDFRDKYAKLRTLRALPPYVNLIGSCPPVYNQGELGSCTAQAIAGALEFSRHKQQIIDFTPSRLFIYYNERVMINTVNEDSGAMIRDGIKSVAKQGAPPEIMYKYDIGMFKRKPPARCYFVGEWFQALEYKRLTHNLNELKTCLASGFPFVFGIMVYDSFADNGKIPMPKPTDSAQGGHAMLMVGYDDSINRFIMRNSWGSGWGNKGYGTIPYDYILDSNLSDDFWMITKVESFGEVK